MEFTATLFNAVRGGVLSDDRHHFALIFTQADGKSVQIAMPMESLDGLKQVVDDLKLLQAGTPEGEIVQ